MKSQETIRNFNNRWSALRSLLPTAQYTLFENGNIQWDSEDIPQPTEEEINAKISELEAEEPMRLLRIERTRLLNETDWEVTRGIEEGIDITELKTYRSALRNLPQEIEAGNIEAPTLNENGELVFNSWPIRGNE